VRHSARHRQLGIETFLTYNCEPPSMIEQWAQTQALAVKALGANALSITFPIYTDSMTSDDVYAEDVCGDPNYQSPPPSILADVVAVDHAEGLAVLLRPTLSQVNLAQQGIGNWRGAIKPADLGAWMASYLQTIDPYLEMAQSSGVESFAIESELDSILSSSEWGPAIALARDTYHGNVVWNYSWHTSQVKHTQVGTSFSIDAYPSLPGAGFTASPAALATMWGRLLTKAKYKLPNVRATTVDEVGISAQDGAYAAPNVTPLPLDEYPFDQAVQANWFTAACSFVKQHDLAGLYFLGPWLNLSQGTLLSGPDPSDPLNLQPRAQAAVRHCFKTTLR
jgi:hypothetical protein